MVAPYEAVSGIELIEGAKSKGIRFVQLQFTDITGVVKAVTIPIHQLEGSVRHGTWFDGSSIEGFTRIAESDQYLMPDMRTFEHHFEMEYAVFCVRMLQRIKRKYRKFADDGVWPNGEDE